VHRLAVQGSRDPSQRLAALAQVTDFREHTLLAGVWFDLLAVQVESESETAYSLLAPRCCACAQRGPRPFPDVLPLPLRDRRHDSDHQAAGG
jgi:hypothetical protein